MRLKHYITPWHPAGHYILPHLFALVVILASLFLVGRQDHWGALGSLGSPPATSVPQVSGGKHLIVPPGMAVPAIAPAIMANPHSDWYVHGVVTRDTGIDLTSTINHWGDVYGTWPVGLTATLATESAINQYADRYGVWPDVSFGIAQFTVQTATGYGVCSDEVSCRNWLDNPYNSIQLAARFLKEIQNAICEPWPYVYVGYNAGPGLGCGNGFYTNPSGMAATNFYGNFLPNLNYVAAIYGGGPPPPPTPTPKPKHHPFPRASWGPLNPYYRHKLSWQASIWLDNRWLGRALDTGRWFPRRHAGFTRTRFAHGAIYTWPRYHRGKATR